MVPASQIAAEDRRPSAADATHALPAITRKKFQRDPILTQRNDSPVAPRSLPTFEEFDHAAGGSGFGATVTFAVPGRGTNFALCHHRSLLAAPPAGRPPTLKPRSQMHALVHLVYVVGSRMAGQPAGDEIVSQQVTQVAAQGRSSSRSTGTGSVHRTHVP